MTFYTPDQTRPGGFVAQVEQPLPVDVDTGFYDSVSAAARTSWMGKAIAEFAQAEPDKNPYAQPDDPDFDPFEHVQGYEDSLSAFIDARNFDDVLKIRQRIDSQRAAESALAGAHWPTRLAAELTAGAADPLNWIGGVGLVGRAAEGASILRYAADGALLGTGVGAAEEALQSRFDPSYSSESAGYRIGASALLMGALGGGAGVLARIFRDEGRLALRSGVSGDAFAAVADADTRAALRTAAEGIERDLTIPKGTDPLVPEMGGSVSAAASRATRIEDETLKSGFGVEKVIGELTPMMRTIQSQSLETRRIAQDLIQTPLRFQKNVEGIASPQAVETMVRLHDAKLAKALISVDDAFLKYRQGKVNPGAVSRITGNVTATVQDMTRTTGGKLTRQQFSEEVGKAMRRSDSHPIPEVAQAAKAVRKELIEPLKRRAIEAGMLPENIDEMLKTAPSYLTRVYNRGKIAAQRDKFEDVLFSALKRYQTSAGERMNEALARVPLLEAKVKKLEDDLSVLRNPAAGDDGVAPAVGSIAAAKKAAKVAKEKRIAAERDLVAARAELRRANAALEQAQKRAEKFRPDEAPADHPLRDVIRDLKRGIQGKSKLTDEQLADREAELRDWERAFDEAGIDVSRMSPDEIIKRVGAGPQVPGFKTAKGSTYEIHEDGTTTRNKAARDTPGHEGDSGLKPRTEKTVYVDKGKASELSGAGLSNLGPKGARVAIKDGKATFLTWNDKEGRWGTTPGQRDIPFYDEPALGREPLELWGKKDDVPGFEAYSKQHAGNEIVELTGDVDFHAPTGANKAKHREMEFVRRRAEVRQKKAAERAAEAEKTYEEARAARNVARENFQVRLAERFEIEKNLARYRLFLDTARNTVDSEAGLANAMDGELRDSVRQITDKVLGQQPGRMMNFAPVSLARGPLKERTLNFVNDQEIEDFLESNIEHVARVYKHSVATDAELAARFGRADMQPQIDAIKEDYARLRRSLPEKGKEKALQKLAKQEADDLRDIGAMRDLIRGTYGLPDNPAGFAARTARVMKQANFIRLMGGMTLSSIPDVGRPVMVHGIERTMMNGIRPLVSNWRGVKLMAKEAKLAGVGLEMVLDNRTMQLTDIFDDYGKLSKFERGMSWATTRMGLASLMTPWNATLKQFSSIIAQSRMLEAITEPATRTAQESEWLAMLGIDDEMSARIAREFALHGETQGGGVMWANTDAWGSADAVEAYRAALLKSVDSTIVTPGVGDRPLWMSTTLGGVLGQFRSFSFASTQHVAMAGLQQRDAAVLNGLLLSVGLGMLTYMVKVDADKRSDNPGKWILEGVDRAGVLGILSDATQISTRLAGVNLGGGRYSGRDSWEVFGGPSVGLAKDVGTVLASVADGAASSAEISAARRLIPFQNLFYLRRLFDAAQEGIEASGYGAMQ